MTLPPTKERGLPRIRADRASLALSLDDVELILTAASTAKKIGVPLNRWVTIHWDRAGAGSKALRATGSFLKSANDWITLQGGQFAYAWVRETGPTKGEHVHIAMHVSPDLGRALGNRQRAWLKAAGATGPYRRGTINSAPIGLRLDHAFRSMLYGERYDDHLARVLAYMVKGADGEASSLFRLPKHEDGGRIVGKRCGTSQNIGRLARRQFDAQRGPSSSESAHEPAHGDDGKGGGLSVSGEDGGSHKSGVYRTLPTA